MQTVQQLITLLLVNLQVAQRMKSDVRCVTSVGMDAQRDRLCHSPAGHEDRRFFAQQFKRNCIPDGPRIGNVALSPRGDWRMPSDALPDAWLRELEGER